MFEKIMRAWTLVTMLKAITQVKTVKSYVFDKYFKKKANAQYGNAAKLKIKKGASVVLKSIAPNADRLVRDAGNVYEVTINFPRFGLSAEILASTINEISSLEGEAQVQAVTKLIEEKLKEHKNDYMTTIEYMSTGALFGKVIDGDGVVLFEFNTTSDPIEFKNNEIIPSFDLIDEALVDELGTEVPYEVLASAQFISRLAAKAKTDELFKTGEAKWLDEEGKRILVVHSKKFIPFRASWTDSNGDKHQFIPDGDAVVIPLHEDVFDMVYGRADHTDAFKAAPQLFFASAPAKLDKGKGWGFETECKAIPFCTRPGALIKLKYTA